MILIGAAMKSSRDSGVVGGPVAEQLLSCLLKGVSKLASASVSLTAMTVSILESSS
jgi:hypothetical protein